MYKTFLKNGPNQLINKTLKTNYNPLGLKYNRIKSFLIRYIKISSGLYHFKLRMALHLEN